MKKQIQQLKELAENCQVFAKKVNLRREAFTEYVTESHKLRIYCGSSYDVVSVYFVNQHDIIHVQLYVDHISMPMSIELDQIKKDIIEWSKMIDEQFPVEIQKYELEKEMIIQSRIEELQSELNNLKK